MQLFSKNYSLRKSRHLFQQGCDWFQKNQQKLSKENQESFRQSLLLLDTALQHKDKHQANLHSKSIVTFMTHSNRSFFLWLVEMCLVLAVALAITIPVRQMWFEPYEIPTGSMRPTFREKDRLTVSKTVFGINVPWNTKHFYFDPTLTQRTSALIFSGSGIPSLDETTTLFYLIPYTKRYVKRLIGKPGDTLYFYGGKIYAVDKDGNHLNEFLDAPWMEKIESIPFLQFEGEIQYPSQNEIQFSMNQHPIGKTTLSRFGQSKGEIYSDSSWIKDEPQPQNATPQTIKTFSDYFGIRNYAMAQIFTKEQVKQNKRLSLDGVDEGALYLVLSHTPNLASQDPIIHSFGRRYQIRIPVHYSIIPLQQKHLNAILDHMYTARFVVKNGIAFRYRYESSHPLPNSPHLPGVPDGTYEFYFGKATQIGIGGTPTTLTKDHPLYSKNPMHIQTLFNLGIDFNTAMQPKSQDLSLRPHRYAYFRSGELFLLGAPIFEKEDETLNQFLIREKNSRFPFKDYGPPLKEDGSIDLQFIQTFGLKVPENHYYVLGDNPSMSADSRVFGFVPQENIEGAPSLIIWPFGDRFGPPNQKPYPWINFPRMVIWSIALICFGIWYRIHVWKRKKRDLFIAKLKMQGAPKIL